MTAPQRNGDRKMDEKQRATRNLNPHSEAIFAMCYWNEDYAFKQRGGSMDFWDSLPESRKRFARDAVKRIRSAKPEEQSEPLVKAHQ